MTAPPYVIFRERLQVDRNAAAGYMKHFVAVPDAVLDELGLKGADRVRGSLNELAFSRVLQQRDDGTVYLRFGEGWLRDAEAHPGDRVTILLEPDPDPNHVEIPAELAEALEAHPAASDEWASFTPGKRRTLAYGVERAKRPETRVLRAEKVVDEILLALGMDPDLS
jgi:hypothetical protein